ncbi:ABC transporter permease subunit [Saccharopolyspora karakumensis]|uniref:ABC transporter permease subunit n=1 Tax=Saccharopolyspora karakumensis TaxID=2530386 RepID=A0A4V2YWJ2_9PSEU|nr:ABC transporter permease subunit [Saccharopolyspora karakumensis]TDD85537.1 ABC transporter permease subunit [Saccharopolyspora karakumensis]
MRTVLRGLLVTAGAVLVPAFVVGALPWLRGDDPAQTVLRARSAEQELDPAVLAAIRRDVGIPDDPVTGVLSWLAGAVRGDFGRSWVSGVPVSDSLGRAAGISVTLALVAALTALVCALLVLAPSLWRAARGSGRVGRGALATGAVLAALPEFLLATGLLVLLAVHWGLAPTSGWSGPANMPLPALALGLPAAGALGRVLASAIDGALAEPWVRVWRANGIRRRVMLRAVVRRSVAVAFPQLVLLFVGLLGSGIVVEAVFAIPGLGATALNAVLAQDLPLVQGCVIVLALLGLAFGGLGVLAHRWMLGPALRSTGIPQSTSDSAGSARWALVAAGALTVAVLAGLLRDPNAIALTDRLQAPTSAHPFGTDSLGRDLLARFGHGALLSIGGSLVVSAVALVVGLASGMTRTRAGVADVLNAVPPVLAGVVVAAVAGPGMLSAVVAVCSVAWIPLAVHARTLTAEVRASGFVRTAIATGASRAHVITRHLLPSVFTPVLRHALIRLPHNALALAGLGYLGLAAPHDSPEWGAILAQSIDYAETAPWSVLFPTAGLALLGLTAALAPHAPGVTRPA